MITITPYKKVILPTTLTSEEITQILQKETSYRDTTNIFKGQKNSSTFIGSITLHNFKIMRYITYRNSFLPVISGKIQETTTGTNIYLTFKLTTFVMMFTILLTGFIGYLFIGSLASLFSEKSNFSPEGILATFGFLLFEFLLCNISFTSEYKADIKKIKEIFEAKAI